MIDVMTVLYEWILMGLNMVRLALQNI